MSSFHVDARVSVKLEYDLAMRLGEFILSSGTEDKQFLALGHKLVRIDEEEQQQQKPVRKMNGDAYNSWSDYLDNKNNLTDKNYEAVDDSYWEKQERIGEKSPPIRIRRSNKIM